MRLCLRRLLVTGFALAVTAGTGAVAGPASGAAVPATTEAGNAPRHIGYTQWGTRADFGAGTAAGVRVYNGKLRIGTPTGRQVYDGRAYDYARWTSPWRTTTYGFSELVPSWEASTPGDTWVSVEARGISMGGSRSSWDTIARWAGDDHTVHRTSAGPQRDDLARVAVDTWETNYGDLRSWQLRVTLHRRAGSTATPRVDSVGAMTSALPDVNTVVTSRPGVARGLTLPVPRYSQMVHAGEYPQYGGGGEAWCSPTSTTMVLGYYRSLPDAAAYAWVRPSYADRIVDNTARATYDYGYQGTGNWPFNTAYAAARTGHAFVTRLHSLREAERFIRAGIPVVASITFGRGQLTGAPIGATNGHLVVIVGFTAAGDVVVNDPAASSNRSVRRTYDRGQFENAWLRRYPANGSMRGSGGIAYIIRDAAHPLPARSGNANW